MSTEEIDTQLAAENAAFHRLADPFYYLTADQALTALGRLVGRLGADATIRGDKRAEELLKDALQRAKEAK